MRKSVVFWIAAVAALVAGAAVPVETSVDVAQMRFLAVEAYAGDTLDFRIKLKANGAPVNPGVASASFLWQTNAAASVAWDASVTGWMTNAAVVAGVVTARWTPPMALGASVCPFFIPVVSGGGASYRIAGAIKVRPSPGADPGTVPMPPPPGATIDFAQVTAINAPWATMEEADAAIAAAIASATNAIVIPPPPDLSGYATTGDVAAVSSTAATALHEASNNLAIAIQNVFDAAQPRSEMGAFPTTNEVADMLRGLPIPSLAGYATETWVSTYVASNSPPPDLTGYATTAYVDATATNTQAWADGRFLQSVPPGYPTESWVAGYVASNSPTPDLTGYATTDYVDATATNTQAWADGRFLQDVPPGYATETWVAGYVASNSPTPDLTGYATTAYVDATATNTQAWADGRFLQSVPAGYPTEQWVSGYVKTNLTGYATTTYVDSTIRSAINNAGNITIEADVTRLMSPDGQTWQDFEGRVLQLSNEVVRAGSIWTNSTPFLPGVTGYVQAVTFTQISPLEYTNSTWGLIVWDAMEDAWFWNPVFDDTTSGAFDAASNLVFSVAWTNVPMYAQMSIALTNMIAGTNLLRQVAYLDNLSDAGVTSNEVVDIVGAFAATGRVAYAYNALEASVAQGADYAAELYDANRDGSYNADQLLGMAARTVTNIVTAVETNYTQWVWDDGGDHGQPTWEWSDEDEFGWWWMAVWNQEGYGQGDDDALELEFYDPFDDVMRTCRRQIITRNALGLARMVDLPPLTNGLVTASVTNGLVTASITNGLVTARTVTNIVEGLSSGAPEWQEAWLPTNTVAYVTNGMAHGTFALSGTVSANTNGWPEGAGVFADVHAAGGYSVAAGIRLVGYGWWPTNDFQAVWWRCGTNVYVNVIVEE